MLFILLIAMSLICTIASEIWTSHNAFKNWYLGFEGKSLIYVYPIVNKKKKECMVDKYHFQKQPDFKKTKTNNFKTKTKIQRMLYLKCFDK